MDAFFGYNQILMKSSNQEDTAYITEHLLYCYKVIPFGLKNANATYQRLVNKVFGQKIGKSVKVFFDDMLVKSVTVKQHLKEL